jgi:hypothetical protein
MEPSDFGLSVQREVSVTPDLVAQATTFITDSSSEADVARLVAAFQASVDARPAERFDFMRDSLEQLAAITAAARSVSAGLAACEAIWRLLTRGVLMPIGSSTFVYHAQFGVVVRRGGGSVSGGSTIDVPPLALPSRVTKLLSAPTSEEYRLASPDLYLRTINLPSLHPLAEAALGDAVECFRMELYTPTAAMLGSAAETAWSELGIALAPFAENRARADLLSDRTSFSVRVDRCLAVYAEGNPTIPGWSRDRLAHLRDAALWTGQVRDSRNVLHPGWSPATPNTREKLAMLLFHATPSLRALYSVIDTVSEPSSVTGGSAATVARGLPVGNDG